MENTVDIREIAQYCKNEYEQKCQKSDRMCGYSILYAVITDEGKMKVSTTPHILAGAEQCYLIHKWSQLAVSCWYETYSIQSINTDGEVRGGELDDEYSFSIWDAGFNRPESISFKRNGEVLYSESLWERGTFVLAKRLTYVWELYRNCKERCSTQYESELFCKLASKEQDIKDLEERLADSTLKEQYLHAEISQYKDLLDDVRSAMKTDC